MTMNSPIDAAMKRDQSKQPVACSRFVSHGATRRMRTACESGRDAWSVDAMNEQGSPVPGDPHEC
jgi:hypothetical protein